MIQCEGCLAVAASAAEADLQLLRTVSELRLGTPVCVAKGYGKSVKAVRSERIHCLSSSANALTSTTSLPKLATGISLRGTPSSTRSHYAHGRPSGIRRSPIASLVAVASNVMRVPVMDRTGLDGLWSYLTFYAGSPEPNLPGDGDNALPFPAALTDELGLRLRDSNGPFDVVVIDSVEQPTPD